MPLINLDQRLVLLWSAKSGSTFIAKWFFYQANIELTDEIVTGVHNYRTFVFYKSSLYAKSLEEYRKDPYSFRFIKFVRDPYERAVSSFIHFLRKASENHPISKELLGVEEIKKDFKMSFVEFVEILKNVDIRECNVHWRSQMHPMERLGIFEVKTIPLKKSMELIPALENELGLKQSGKGRLEKYRNRNHHTVKKTNVDLLAFFGDTQYKWTEATEFPPAYTFYNRDLRIEVFKIYREDFKNYGSNKFGSQKMIERESNKQFKMNQKDRDKNS